jgi:hypothetical protein
LYFDSYNVMPGVDNIYCQLMSMFLVTLLLALKH